MLITILLVGIVVLLLVFILAKIEQAKLRKRFRKYEGLINKEDFEEKLDINIKLKQAELDKLVRTKENVRLKSETWNKN